MIRLFLLSLLGLLHFNIIAQRLGETRRLWMNDVVIADTIYSVQFPDGINSFELEISGAMKGLRDVRGENRQSWSVDLMNGSERIETIELKWGNSSFGSIDDTRYLRVSSGKDGWEQKFVEGVSVYSNDNALVISSPKPGEASVSVGNEYPRYAGNIYWNNVPITEAIIRSNGSLTASYISFYGITSPRLDSGLTYQQIAEITDRSELDTPVGIWYQLDRDTDTDYARPGGSYTLAIVPSPDENDAEYLIIYIDGATVNSQSWREGMIKGSLTPTAYENSYHLNWITSHLESTGHECHATINHEGILTLSFPLLKSQIRFTRR